MNITKYHSHTFITIVLLQIRDLRGKKVLNSAFEAYLQQIILLASMDSN